jgi:tetratricopeptide (TPR) repeat protein
MKQFPTVILLLLSGLFLVSEVQGSNLFEEAMAAKASGDAERALYLFEKCIAEGERVLDAFWESGLLLLEEGKYRRAFELSERAIPVFSAHLEAHPEDHMNWFRLGYIFELRSSTGYFREWEKARTCLTRALEHSPGNSFYLLHLGYVLYKMGEGKEAEEKLRGVLLREPLNLEARYWLAVVLASERKYGEAEEELRFLLEHAPEDFGRLREVEKLLRKVERKG